LNKCKNEIFTSEKISTEAHLIAEISRIEIQDGRNNFNNIQVKVIVDNFNKTLKSDSRDGRDFVFEKKCKM